MSKFIEQLFLGLFSVIILFSLVACSKSETREYIRSTKNKNNKISGVDSPILVVGTSSGTLENSVHQFSSAEVGQSKKSGMFTLQNKSTENVTELTAIIESEDYRFNSEDGTLAGSGDCTDKLETGKTCKFEIVFEPKSGGDKQANVVFNFKAKGQDKTMVLALAGRGIGLEDELANPIGGLVIAGKDLLSQFSAKPDEQSEVVTIKIESTSNKVISNISSAVPLENGFEFAGGKFPGVVPTSVGSDDKSMCGQKDLVKGESCKIAVVYKRARELSKDFSQESLLHINYKIAGVEKVQDLKLTLVGNEKIEEVTVETNIPEDQGDAAEDKGASAPEQEAAALIEAAAGQFLSPSTGKPRAEVTAEKTSGFGASTSNSFKSSDADSETLNGKTVTNDGSEYNSADGSDLEQKVDEVVITGKKPIVALDQIVTKEELIKVLNQNPVLKSPMHSIGMDGNNFTFNWLEPSLEKFVYKPTIFKIESSDEVKIYESGFDYETQSLEIKDKNLTFIGIDAVCDAVEELKNKHNTMEKNRCEVEVYFSINTDGANTSNKKFVIVHLETQLEANNTISMVDSKNQKAFVRAYSFLERKDGKQTESELDYSQLEAGI